MTWTNEELSAVATPDELRIATRRRDGTLRDPVTIWHVRVGDDLYVRSVNGPASGWYRGAQTRHEARISAGGVEKDVTLIRADPDIGDQIDAEYRSKYGRYAENTLRRISSPEARSTTLKLVPVRAHEPRR
jgi:hypothetical protein